MDIDRGMWLHPGTMRSSKFICALCRGEAYYPQANNTRKDNPIGIRIPYNFCPHCGKPMMPVVKDGIELTEFYRYAMLYRPPMPGALPREGLVVSVDKGEFCEPLNRHVWGYALYDRKLTAKELRQYEMEIVEVC